MIDPVPQKNNPAGQVKLTSPQFRINLVEVELVLKVFVIFLFKNKDTDQGIIVSTGMEIFAKEPK